MDDLRAFVLALVEPLVRYARPYGATVVEQHADDTVDLRPDSTKLDRPTRVPLRLPVGLRARVRPGTRVLLAYEGGRRTGAYAELVGLDGLLELTIKADTKVTIDAPAIDFGSLPVVREGDTVTVGSTGGVIKITAPAGGMPTKVKA